MRWNHSNVYFSRPIRWLLALFGSHVIQFEYGGVHSGNLTRGLRTIQPAEFPVKDASDYFNRLRAQGIILEKHMRREVIQAQIETLVAKVDGRYLPDEELLSEVANLVEAPSSLIGSFDPVHLRLPREVLISVMKKHQRYFPVFQSTSSQSGHTSGLTQNVLSAGEGELLPYFITVANQPSQDGDPIPGGELITEGNHPGALRGCRFLRT